MFTFGIFTTHIPYIAIVAFYAYFLIFGVNQTASDKIKITEKSATVQIHLNNAADVNITISTDCFYSAFVEKTASNVFEKSKVKQRWKYFGADKISSQHYLNNT
ncbi:hypothetical protein N9164_15535, partial [Draconibacterium sp.]|nr:hypothetical protein [Draconibacterium sp.]